MRSIWGKTAKEKPMAATAPLVALGASAPDFRLPATDGRTYSFADVAGKHGTVIVFICNHCPYVKALIDRMVADARTLLAEGFGFAAICSNDAKSYPEDSFANMQRFAKTHDFPFPYLHDAAQRLKYRGRLDEGRMNAPPAGARRELVEAMRAIAVSGEAPSPQLASMGCSIKWKAA